MANNNRNQQDSAQKGQGKTGQDSDQNKKQSLSPKTGETQGGQTKQGSQSKEKKSKG